MPTPNVEMRPHRPEIIRKQPGESADFAVLMASAFNQCWEIRESTGRKPYGFLKHYEDISNYCKTHNSSNNTIDIGKVLVDIITTTSPKYMEVGQWAIDADLEIELGEVNKIGLKRDKATGRDLDRDDKLFRAWALKGLDEAVALFNEQMEMYLLEDALNYSEKGKERTVVDAIFFIAVSGEAKSPRWSHPVIKKLSETLRSARNYFNVQVMCSPTFAMSAFDFDEEDNPKTENFGSELFRFLSTFGPAFENVRYFNSLQRTPVHGVFNARELKLSTYHPAVDVATSEYSVEMFPAQPMYISHPNGDWKKVLDIAERWFASLKSDLIDLAKHKLNQFNKTCCLSKAIDDLIERAAEPIYKKYNGKKNVVEISASAYKQDDDITIENMTDKDILDGFDLSNVSIDVSAFHELKGRAAKAYRNILVTRKDLIEIIKENPRHETWAPKHLEDIKEAYRRNNIDPEKLGSNH